MTTTMTIEPLEPDEEQRLGQLAYETYGDHVDWVSVTGNTMPIWDDLPDAIREAWIDSATTVREDIVGNFPDFTVRELKMIGLSLVYTAEYYDAGAVGHNQIVLIAKLAKALGFANFPSDE